MHHKRKRPKSTRAGCLLCKPHKRQGTPPEQRCRPGELGRLRGLDADAREALRDRLTYAE